MLMEETDFGLTIIDNQCRISEPFSDHFKLVLKVNYKGIDVFVPNNAKIITGKVGQCLF